MEDDLPLTSYLLATYISSTVFGTEEGERKEKKKWEENERKTALFTILEFAIFPLVLSKPNNGRDFFLTFLSFP